MRIITFLSNLRNQLWERIRMGSGSYTAYLSPNDQIEIFLGVNDDHKCNGISSFIADLFQKISI